MSTFSDISTYMVCASQGKRRPDVVQQISRQMKRAWRETRTPLLLLHVTGHRLNLALQWPGADIMEADDRQMSTVFTVQLSFHH